MIFFQKRKRKAKLNHGEKLMSEYHEQHVQFIHSAFVELRKKAGNYFNVSNESTGDKAICIGETIDLSLGCLTEVSYTERSLEKQNSCLETIHGQLICNNASTTCFIEYQNETFLIPPKSSFIMSDFQDIGMLLCKGVQYDVILMDPPWENKSVKRSKRYAYLPEHDLKKIPIGQLLSRDGVVFIWVTNKQKYIEFVKEILFKYWDIELVGIWHWIKMTRNGEYVVDLISRHKKPYEPLLVGRHRHSSRSIPGEKVFCSVPSMLHSSKPCLNEIINSCVSPTAKCLELFARNLSPNWTSWGNEKYTIALLDVCLTKNPLKKECKEKRIVVRLVSMAGTGHFYTTTRNRLTEKLTLMKHDPVVNKHVLYTEQKVKKGEKKTKAGGR